MSEGKWSEDERARRQATLGLDCGDDSLHQEEIEFYEKFLALGHQPKYIKRRAAEPSNDFIWVDFDNREFEQKTTKANYLTIHGRIISAASRAARNPYKSVKKDNFVIDIRDEELTNDLRHALEGYNDGRRKYRLKELWIMSRGQLFRIDLRQ